MLHGAINRQEKPFPIFQRWSWAEDINSSVLILNDPTLFDNDLMIGWWQGNSKRYLLPEACDFIKIVLEKLGYSNQQLLFYGTSAGGFGALMMAGHFKGSIALVNNPQTNCLEYKEALVLPLLEKKFASLSKEVLFKQAPNRFSVSAFYQSIDFVPKIIYYQCIADSFHFENHYLPFVQALYQYQLEPLNFQSILYPKQIDGSAHDPLTRPKMIPIINKTIKNIEMTLELRTQEVSELGFW